MKTQRNDLIQRMLSGDRTSFDEIVLSYSGDVHRLCALLLRDSDEAMDIVQESMLRLVRAVREGKFRRSNGSIKGFLTTTARNLCIDSLKKRSRFSVNENDSIESLGLISNEQTPDAVSENLRFEEAFESALSFLSDVQRTVLVLREVNDESFDGIAQSLNLTVNNVRTHLWRAREKMRQILMPYWINR